MKGLSLHFIYSIVIAIFWCNSLFAISITNGTSPHILDPGAFNGATYSTHDRVEVKNAHLLISQGNTIDFGASDFWIAKDSSNHASTNMIGGNISLDEFIIGYNGNAESLFQGGNINLSNAFHIAYNSSASANASFYNIHLYTPTPKGFTIGRSGSANSLISNSNFQNLDYFRVGQNSSAFGHADIINSSITSNNFSAGYSSTLLSTANINNSTISRSSLGGTFEVGRSGSGQLNISSSNIYNYSTFSLATNNGGNAIFNMSQSNITVNSFNVGRTGTAIADISSSNIHVYSKFHIGNYTGAIGNLMMTDTTLTYKDFGIGSESGTHGNVIFDNATLRSHNSGTIFVGQRGAANLLLLNSSLHDSSAIAIAEGAGPLTGSRQAVSGNFTTYHSNILTKDFKVGNRGWGEAYIYSSNLIATNTSNGGSYGISVGTSTDGGGKMVIDNSEITSSSRFTVGSGVNSEGIAVISHSNINLGDRFYVSGSSSSSANVNISSSNLNIGSDLYISVGTGSTGYLNVNSSNITHPLGTKTLHLGYSGHAEASFQDSSINNFNNLVLANTGSANVNFINSQMKIKSNAYIRKAAGAPTMLSFSGGNTNIVNDTYLYENGSIQLIGGNTIFYSDQVVISGGSMIHLIDRYKTSGEHIGHFQLGFKTQAKGNIIVGIHGGAAFTSTNTFHIQKAVGGHGVDIPSIQELPNGYDIARVDDVGDGTSRKGLAVYVASANVEAGLNINSPSVHSSGKALGQVSISNLSPSVQHRGLRAMIKLNSGDVNNVMANLTAAGYTCTTLTGTTAYDFQIHIDASDLPTGTGYFNWDFRNPQSGVIYAELQNLLVIPTPSGSIFNIR